MFGARDWVRDHPVATKRLLRAMFKAADFCAAEPGAAAQQLIDGGFGERYDYALRTIKEIPYAQWREYVPRRPCAFTRSACTRQG